MAIGTAAEALLGVCYLLTTFPPLDDIALTAEA